MFWIFEMRFWSKHWSVFDVPNCRINFPSSSNISKDDIENWIVLQIFLKMEKNKPFKKKWKNIEKNAESKHVSSILLIKMKTTLQAIGSILFVKSNLYLGYQIEAIII